MKKQNRPFGRFCGVFLSFEQDNLFFIKKFEKFVWQVTFAFCRTDFFLKMCNMRVLCFSILEAIVDDEFSRIREGSEKFVVQTVPAFMSAIRTNTRYLFKFIFFSFLGEHAVYNSDHILEV